ncbi:MAG: transposase [Silvanigrellales bacterium]|nr:transposase [Silvanigrellales bacterium]
MIVDSVPAPVRSLANDAKDLCEGDFSYRVLVALLVGLFFGLPSLSAIVRSFTFVCSVSSLSRGIRAIPHEALLRRSRNKVAALIAAALHPERRFVLAIDDTLVRKFGASPENCYWFDHSSGKAAKGRNYLCFVVLDILTGHAYPVDAVLLRGTKHADYRPRIEVLKERLLVLKKAGFGALTLVADAWFSDKKLFEWLDDQGFDFEIEIRINRKLTYLDKKALGSVGEKGKMVYPSTSGVALTLKRNTAFSGGAPKQVAGGVVRLFGSSLRLKLAAVWNKDDDLSEKPFACYVTNRTGLCLTRIWALSRFRWGIECYFRAGKQDFSFDALPTESSDAAFRLVALGMFLYCNLELARHDPDARPMGKPERRRKYPPLTSHIKMLRRESEERTYVRSLVMKPARDAILSHLRGRREPGRSCLKPRDSARRQVERAA